MAKSIAFNTSNITVPAGANIAVSFDNKDFDNKDSGIPHNFVVYTDSFAYGFLCHDYHLQGRGDRWS